MSQEHIMRAFDRDLETVQALIMKMGGLVEVALLDAARALEQGDLALAEKVRAGDSVIDTLEEDLNSECARLIALRAPIASDLRVVLAVLKIAGNLERCGDYAKNMAKRALVLEGQRPLPDALGAIRRMASQVQLLLKGALDAFVARDAGLAGEIRLRDTEIDQMYNALFRELLTHMMEDSRNISTAMHLHFIGKNIERMGDHVTGICEQVIYLSTGTLPKDARPKISATDIGAELGA